MSLVANVMAKTHPEYCSYVSVKVDVELLPNLKIAAARKGVAVQEYLSDLINEPIAKDALNKPVKRKPPRPRKPRE